MAELLKVSASTSQEVRAVVQGLRWVPRELASNIRKFTKSELAPEWQRGLAGRAATRAQRRVLVDTARIAVSDQNVTLKSATVGRPLPGGLDPKQSAAAFEFGANDTEQTYTARSRRGRTFKVTRHTRRQLPRRSRTGWVVFPTAADLIPRFASLWVQTAYRTIYEAIERK